MMFSSPRPRQDSESGFVLLAAICLVVLLLISLAIAAPKMARAIQRDKELEAIHRGEQYRLAIKKYYKQFGAFPTSVDQLLNTNNMRFLRQKYRDPLTGKDDWKPIPFGQAHVRPLGFFGKPLSAVGGIAAASPVGGGITPGMYAIDSTSTDANGNPTSGSSGSDNTAGTSNDTMGLTGTSVGSSGIGSSPGSPSSFGSPAGGLGSGFSGTSSPGATTGTGFGTTGSTSAPMFGGSGTGPIVGFTLPVDKPSLIDYMEQTAYNKWEFNFDPAADQLQQAVSLLGGGGPATMGSSSTPPSADNSMGFGASPGSNNSLFGSPNGGTTNGNSGTTGNGTTGSSPPTGTPPDPGTPQP